MCGLLFLWQIRSINTVYHQEAESRNLGFVGVGVGLRRTGVSWETVTMFGSSLLGKVFVILWWRPWNFGAQNHPAASLQGGDGNFNDEQSCLAAPLLVAATAAGFLAWAGMVTIHGRVQSTGPSVSTEELSRHWILLSFKVAHSSWVFLLFSRWRH